MQKKQLIRLGVLIFFLGIHLALWAKTERYRCMWREEPSTTMVIGWDQVSGNGPILKYDVVDHGTNAADYAYSARPAKAIASKGMRNHFARLTHLNPNTTYYFIIQDSEGISQRMSFQTTPDNPNNRLSIIAGGDSRNHRKARIAANKIVGKLRPHFVMFGGDMTAGDTPTEWIEWLDDWQNTMGSDGRLTPIVVTRGNHEASNTSLVELFDVAKPDLYYALTFGGNLVRIYTLNTLIPSGGDQRIWLEKDLVANQKVNWRIAQYHHTIRPHTRSKPERDELLLNWATLFHKYKLRLAVESDAHVVKWTYPIKPSRAAGSEMGFIRDDERGTTYIGEGCWGAPLRDNNDDKKWTRNSGSFNQFKLIFVDRRRIEVRTVKIEASEKVREVNHQNVFKLPPGLGLWQPSNGAVVSIVNKNVPEPKIEKPPVPAGPPLEIINCAAKQSAQDVIISWTVKNDRLQMNYQVQRSTDNGRNFVTIADYRGKKNGMSSYNCRDLDIGKKVDVRDLKYRVSYVDQEGKTQWQEPELKISLQDETVTSPKPSTPGKLPPMKPLKLEPNGMLKVAYQLPKAGKVEMILMTPELREVARVNFENQPSGKSLKNIDISRAPKGKYLLIVKGNAKVIQRYRVVK